MILMCCHCGKTLLIADWHYAEQRPVVFCDKCWKDYVRLCENQGFEDSFFERTQSGKHLLAKEQEME